MAAIGRWRETAILLALALVAEACFLWGFVLPYSLPEHYTKPLLDLVGINGAHPISFNYFLFSWVISFGAYWLALLRCPSFPARSYMLILGVAAAVFNLTLLFMYPTGAADLLDYIVRARQLAHYGDNPWLHVPSEAKYAHDPLRPYIGSWASTTSPYGPVWELLAAGASLLAGADLWRNLIFFKGLVILCYGASVILIYATLARVKPEWAARGTLFFAWNPLLLWETAGNGHNDMVMIAFMLLALYLATFRGFRLLLAPAALALAALVKFVPALLLLPLLALLWRDAWDPDDKTSTTRAFTRALMGGGVFLLVAIAVYAPFWIGPDTVGALWRSNLFTASIPNSIKDFLVDNRNMPLLQAMGLVRTGALLLTVLTVALQAFLLLLPRQEDEEAGLKLRFFSACYSIIFIYLIFATLWFQPWYQLWLIALTPLVARRTHFARTVAVNAGGVANYFIWDFLVLWNNSWGQVVQWTAAMAVNLPPLLVTAYQYLAPGTVAEESAANPQPNRSVEARHGEATTASPPFRRSGAAHERANTGHSTHI